MMAEQLLLTDLLDELDDQGRQEAVALQRELWKSCWGWSGPVVGEPCEIDDICVSLADGTGTIYAYTERCLLIEERPDGRWLAEIAMGIVHGKPWRKDGTRVLLDILDIWPPTKDLWAKRREQS